jgi:hypothetical protein
MASTVRNNARSTTAEFLVLQQFVDRRWEIYFPYRDKGFDFVVSKRIGSQILWRPIQVKGIYPTVKKKDRRDIGLRGKLSRLDPHMVLAMPFFKPGNSRSPVFIAYIPLSKIRQNPKLDRPHWCLAASHRSGSPRKKSQFEQHYDTQGLKEVENPAWGE